jgi:hypothetical protein
MTWQRARPRSDDRAARLLESAEHDAEAAATRYRTLKEAAAAPASANGDRRPMPTWQQMLLLVVGGGLLTGLLIIWPRRAARPPRCGGTRCRFHRAAPTPATAAGPAASAARGGPGTCGTGDARGRGGAAAAATGEFLSDGTGRSPDTMS